MKVFLMKIGLEVHVALPTKSKLFCSCNAKSPDTEPNTAICPICMGFPGSKPMLNREAVTSAISIAKALGCAINTHISFSRKVYFYPDLPKSYQITQLDSPVGNEGLVEYKGKGVRIRRVQIEEDPAKIIRGDEYTLLDFNRSGVPLVEIVTEPDMDSEEDMREFITELRSILYYLDVDIDRELKTDLNISVAESRVEVKNVTGIKNLVEAAHYEIGRQKKMMIERNEIPVETRSYNEVRMITVASREKESDEEYGFIYEPDLATYDISEMKAREAVYATAMAEEYSKRYHANSKPIREAILFDREALRLIDSAKERYNMQLIMNGIAALQRHNAIDLPGEAFCGLLEMMKNGAEIDAGVLRRVRLGEKIDINTNILKVEDIEKEARDIARDEGILFGELRNDKKVFNFLVGKIAKKYGASPRDVSEKLHRILEK